MTPLAEFALKSSVVLLGAGLAAVLCRRLGAAYRHLIWTAGFCAVLLLPLLQAVLPSRALPILPAAAAPAAPFRADRSDLAPRSTRQATTLRRSEQPESAGPSPAERLAPAAASSAPDLEHPKTSFGDGDNRPRPADGTERSWHDLIPAVWLIGVLVLLGRHGISLAILARAVRRSPRLDASRFSGLASRAGVKRWMLIQDPAPSGPRTWGALRPVIAIPESASAWPQERLEAVLLHELAHVRRLDSLTQSIAAIACAANWFNPLVWIAADRARKEAEQAADDTVLMAGVKPSFYAEALVQTGLATKSPSVRFFSAGVPLMKQSKIEARIGAILSDRRQRRRVSPAGIAATSVAALALAGPCAVLRAEAAQPDPVSPVMAAIEVTHAAQANTNAAPARHATKAQRAQPHRTRAAAGADESLKRQVAELQAELGAERAQMLRMQIELRALEARPTLNKGRPYNGTLIQQDAEKARLEANVEAANADVQVSRADIDAKRAELHAAQAAMNELERQYKAGVAPNLQVLQSQADLVKRQAELQESEAKLQAALAKLKAELAAKDSHASADLRAKLDTEYANYDRAHADQQIAVLKAQLEEAAAKLNRDRRLHDQGAISKEVLDQQAADLAALKALVRKLEAERDSKTKH